MCFMQTESVLQTKNRSRPAKNRFSVALTQTPRTKFHSPYPWRLHMKFGFDWPSGFGEEDLWKWWTNSRTTEHVYTISSSMSLKAQVN